MPNNTCPDCGKIIPGKGAVLFGQCMDGLHVCPTAPDVRMGSMKDERARTAFDEWWNDGECEQVEDEMAAAGSLSVEMDVCEITARHAYLEGSARLDRALALLREVEWNDDECWCPTCSHSEHAGHAPDCKLKALLEESDADQA